MIIPRQNAQCRWHLLFDALFVVVKSIKVRYFIVNTICKKSTMVFIFFCSNNRTGEFRIFQICVSVGSVELCQISRLV